MNKNEISQFKRALIFSNSIIDINLDNLKYLFEFTDEFNKIYLREKSKLPYHINLIDELHANENAHSRIFSKLLRYTENNQFPFLIHFLKDVCKFNINVEKPVVKKVDSCGRIDIPIFDKNYVVIIENKVTDSAADQNTEEGGQLARYIETINIKYDRQLDKIYVVYTPKYTRQPQDNCWVNKNKVSYKDEFKDRFCSISYRDDIYPWFKNKILPTIQEKDFYLRSAIEQYIDHLEGLFNLRSTNKNMNMKLQDFIKTELGLEDNNYDKAIEILSEKENELNNAIDQIQLLKNDYQRKKVLAYFEDWKELLKKEYPNLIIAGDNFKLKENIINLGIKFSIENQDYVALIECNECSKPNIYIGIGRHFSSKTKYKIPNSLKEVLEKNDLKDSDDYWYGWKYTSLERAYNKRLKDLIKDISILIDVQ